MTDKLNNGFEKSYRTLKVSIFNFYKDSYFLDNDYFFNYFVDICNYFFLSIVLKRNRDIKICNHKRRNIHRFLLRRLR